jgi:Phosphodiester glycosidase
MVLQPVRSSPEVSPGHLRRLRLALGAATTAHVATYALDEVALRVRMLPGPTPLEAWCREEGVAEAIVGGFYVRSDRAGGGTAAAGTPLGELRTNGVSRSSLPFTAPWGGRRACIHSVAGAVRIARRDELPRDPAGDVLQCGPLLVREGEPIDHSYEGFSAGADQFDSDITEGRYPRAALGCDGERLIAFACDGRADDEAGLTLEELAEAMVELGAREAVNLDGGGSTSLVCGGVLRNVPRESHGVPLPGGRPIATALVFAPR